MNSGYELIEECPPLKGAMGDEKNTGLTSKVNVCLQSTLLGHPPAHFYLVSPLCCETEHCGALLRQAKAAEQLGLIISEQSTETRL